MTNPHFQLYIDGSFCEGAGGAVMQSQTQPMVKIGPVFPAPTNRMLNVRLLPQSVPWTIPHGAT